MAGDETTKLDLSKLIGNDDSKTCDFVLQQEVTQEQGRIESDEVSFSTRYHLGEELARGGNGIIFKAYDLVLNREVALKVLRDGGHQETARRRFVNEAQIVAMLQHPSVVPIYELGRNSDNECFISMPVVHGETLDKLLAGRSSPEEELPRFLKIFEKVCQGVAYAHEKGVIHRDLKPNNIMIGSFGEVFVMDWGIAKAIYKSGKKLPVPEPAVMVSVDSTKSDFDTDLGNVQGTPRFMSPEQARGEVRRIDKRTDVFSLGAILCIMLTGDGPYRGELLGEILFHAQRADMHSALELLDASGLDEELVKLAKDCLQGEPEHRPRDACEVANRITHYLESKTEEFDRDWLNHTTDGVWDWNLQTNNLYLSPCLKRLLGYSDLEIPNTTESREKLVHPEDYKRAMSLVHQHLENGKPFSIPVRYRHKDGSTVWILSRGVALRGEAGRFTRIVGTHTDITALMHATDALAEQGRMVQLEADIGTVLSRGNNLPEVLQRCVDELVRHLGAAFAGIWVGSPSSEALALEARAGVRVVPDGLDGAVPVELGQIIRIAEERRPRVTNAAIGDSCIADREWARRERVVAFSGHPLIYRDRVVGVLAMCCRQPLSTANLDALQAVATSISHAIAHWQTVEGLRKSEERFTLAVQGTDEGIFDWNVATGEVYLAPRFKELLGYQEHELESSYEMWEERLHPQDHDRVLNSLQQHLQGNAPYQVEYRLRCKSGEYRCFQARGQALWDADGRPVRMLGAILDITEQRRNNGLHVSKTRSTKHRK